MFGSKLRSWMENHIGRPRKKGNKHKQQQQQQQQLPANSATCSSGSAGGVYECTSKRSTTHGAIKCSLPTSPVLGTANPTGGYSSPVRRREVSPIQCHTPSRYGWQSPDQDATITSPKSDNLLYAPQRYQHHQQLTVHTAPNSKHNSSADKSPAKVNCSSSSISSLSWSTGSKEPNSANSKKVELELSAPPMPMPMPTLVQQDYEYGIHGTLVQHNNHLTAEFEVHDEVEADYEEVIVPLRESFSNANANNNNNNNNFANYQRPHSENLQRYAYEPNSCQIDDDSLVPRYGRLLPSKLPAQTSDSIESLHVQSECLPAPTAGSAFGRLRAPRGGLRGGNFMGAAPAVNAPGRLGVAPPPHSLSSPESAYSTGYSTDGTSPCAANYNPPEYYINMRTGTHYFPKSINSLAIEAQRYKFGLNRIEEMSPLDPLPKSNFDHTLAPSAQAVQQARLECCSPLTAPTQKLYESSSPRQRCRIRTNPWYSNAEAAAAAVAAASSATNFGMPHHMPATGTMTTGQIVVGTTFAGLKGAAAATMRMEIDANSMATTASSGMLEINNKAQQKQSGKLSAAMTTATRTTCLLPPNAYASSASSSSLTEVENAQHTTVKRKHYDLLSYEQQQPQHVQDMQPVKQQQQQQQQNRLECQDTLNSDDEATLNEMFGKFDESYIYEKETDIISSDSATDATDYTSELDTGQDAGDECDTDELLDIDFIDTSSIQEVLHDRHDLQRNLGSCSYYTQHNDSPIRQLLGERKASVRSRRIVRNSFRGAVATYTEATTGATGSGGATYTAGVAAQQRRRKRFLKTRKKGADHRDKVPNSPLPKPRESRSVGGTPVCLRRNYLSAKDRIYKTSPLSQRANSLIFTGPDAPKHFMTIAESEKALLKADLEADMKYRQLIMEAESLLESMKNSLQSIPRDTPVASPRRLNPLANKRVEMLKHSEVETKKQSQPQTQQQQQQQSPQTQQHNTNKDNLEHELAAAINKRIELLKFETASAPNSPRMSRCSPRKTHLTNFINQNAPQQPAPSTVVQQTELYKPPQSPQLQLSGRRFNDASSKLTPPGTPRHSAQSARRARIAAHLLHGGSESDLDVAEDLVNHNYWPEQQQEPTTYNNADYNNQNVAQAPSYCPHSEPLKRKVYKGSSSFERIKKSFDMELEISKQQTKPQGFSYERHSQKTQPLRASSTQRSIQDMCALSGDSETAEQNNRKQQILLSTIVDLKRSLEYQSYELNGLNGD